jgi:hemerythrin-like domain-containing protein
MPPSIARQTPAQLGGAGSILRRQQRDHEELDRLLDAVASTSGQEQEAALAALARLVFPHAFAEESVLWPLARRVLGSGERLTLQIEEEHQQINELWRRLESTPVGSSERMVLIAEISDLLRRDARDEEDELLPRLQERLSHRQLRRVGRAWELVRRTAPTHPHPVVARRPPGNVLAALPLTAVDRARDRLDAMARGGSGAAPRLRAVSAGLGRIGARIEQLPPLRAGERSATHVAAHAAPTVAAHGRDTQR